MARRGFLSRILQAITPSGRRTRREEQEREFWRAKAVEAVNQIPWEQLYVDDGAPDRVRESDPQYDDIAPGNDEPGIGFNDITPERVLELGERIGYDQLTAAVNEKKYIQDLYWENDTDHATERWLHRREDLPDWFWWYHGYSS